MASKARQSFDSNLKDIESLVDFYKVAELLAKDAKTEMGEGEDVVLRSAIVLLVTFWEAYVEDVVEEALEHIVKHAPGPDKLPKGLKQEISKELKADKNEIALWHLAGNGWKAVVQDRLPAMKESRNRSFNTPKSTQTKEFFEKALGISDITKAWTIDDKTPQDICNLLDKLIEIRGRIAHRGKLPKKISVAFVVKTKEFISKIVSLTGGRLNTELKSITGKPLW